MAKMLIGAALLAASTLGLAGAQAAGAANPAPSALERYERTGQFVTCINIRQISATRVLNAHQILFEMKTGHDYLAEPKHCAGLDPTLGLSYNATTGQLCNTSIIYIVDMSSASPKRGTCDIERFEKLTKKPKQKSATPVPSAP